MSQILDSLIGRRAGEAGAGWLDRSLEAAQLSLGLLKVFFSSSLALGLALFSFLLLGLILSGWAALGWFLLGVLICAVPGWFACKLLYGLEYAKRLEFLGHTLMLGLLLVTFFSIIIAVAGLGLTVLTMLMAASIATLSLFLLGRGRTTPLSGWVDDNPALTRIAITVGLLIVLIITVGPFLNVGRQVGETYAYAPYFNRDFLRNIAFGAQLSKGIVPPVNPYFEGETLHYYWFQMVFPALVYRLSALSVSLENIFLLSTLLVNIIFVFVFVHYLRRFLKTRVALIIVLGLAFVAESYQAPFKAILSLQPTHWALEETWLGAIALPPVGYFFQSFLYLPHHFAALIALLLVFPLLPEQSESHRLKRTMAAAIILILASGFSFFIVAFGFLWAGSYLALQTLGGLYLVIKNNNSKQERSSLITTILSGIIIGVAALASYVFISSLGMLLDGTDSWQINLSTLQFLAPLHFLVMLGPMAIFGSLGFVRCIRHEKLRVEYSGLLWLFLSALLVVTFLLPPVAIGTWEVSQKLGTVLRVAMLALSGIFLDDLVRRRPNRIVWTILLLFCLSAVPNLFAYEYIHFNIRNSNLLTYIPISEMKAAEWIRQQTPLDAIIQAWPGGQASAEEYYRSGENDYSIVAVFGERQTAIGDPQFAHYFVSPLKAQALDTRDSTLRRIYEEPNPVDVAETLAKLHIDYVYWGVSERRCCLENLGWYETSALFEEVYNQDGVSIFRFKAK